MTHCATTHGSDRAASLLIAQVERARLLAERQGRAAFVESLELVRIDWEQTPLDVLGKLIKYEAVHAMHSVDDLRVRLRADRRIFGLFHPDMPDEPLIFVEVAFTCGMARSIQALLDIRQPVLACEGADTVTFYSISNTQKVLKGLNLGDDLIKRVVARLSNNHPQLTTFATLSPIPGFRKWLEPLLDKAGAGVIGQAEASAVARCLEYAGWQEDANMREKMRLILLKLCAHYLLKESQSAGKVHKPIDPVANFHLHNGAEIAQIHFLADISDKGLAQSAGMMVNYHYRLQNIQKNQQRFAEDGIIVASESIRGYL